MITHEKINLPALPRGLFLHHAFQPRIFKHFTRSSVSQSMRSFGFPLILRKLLLLPGERCRLLACMVQL